MCLVTAGPHMSSFCVQTSEILQSQGKFCDVIVFPTLRPIDPDYLAEVFRKYSRIFIVEELFETGGLFDEIQHTLAGFSESGSVLQTAQIYHRAVAGSTFSTLDPIGLYRHFELLPDDLVKWVLKNV